MVRRRRPRKFAKDAKEDREALCDLCALSRQLYVVPLRPEPHHNLRTTFMSLAVIFDVDGVLTDSYVPHYKSWERMFGEIGVEFNDEQFRSTFGRTNRDIFAQLYPGETMTAERTKELGDRKEALYREIINANFTPLP